MSEIAELKRRGLERLKRIKEEEGIEDYKAPSPSKFIGEDLPADDGFFINRWANEYAKIAAEKERESKKKEEELKKKKEVHDLRRKLILEKNGYDIGEFEGD